MSLRKFIPISDLHLTDPARGYWNYRAISGDAWHALDTVIDACLADPAIEGIIASGDIVDKPMTPAATVHALCQRIERLAQAGKFFYYLLGQHDGQQRWSGLHQHARHIGGQTFDLCGATAHAFDWTPPDRLPEALAAIPATAEIVFCHQVWGELFRNNHEGLLADIPHAEYVFTGDLHQHRQVIVDRVDGTSLMVLSHGALAMCKINEPEHLAYYVCAVQDGHVDHIESVPLVSRPVVRVEILTETDLDRFVATIGGVVAEATEEEATAQLPLPLQTPILHVKFDPSLPRALPRIEAATAHLGHLFAAQMTIADHVVEVVPTPREIAEVGWESTLAEEVEPGSETFLAIRRLLTTHQPYAQELVTMRAEFLAARQHESSDGNAHEA